MKETGKIVLFLIVLPLLAIALVDPRGNFPLNDDWSYALSVKHFAETGELKLSSWPAMSLIWQVVYAGLFCKLVGFSFTALRLLTIVVALVSNLLFYTLFKRIAPDGRLAIVGTLLIFFNPIYFNLVFTFMTEIHFFFWFGLAFLSVLKAYEKEEGHSPEGRSPFLWLGSGFASLAFLIRQHGLLIPAALFCLQCFQWARRKITLKQFLQESSATLFLPLLTYTVFHYWYVHIHGATPSYQRKWNLLNDLNWEQVSLNLWGSLAYLAWFLFPLLIPIVYAILKTSGRFEKLIYGAFALLLFLGILGWHTIMPAINNAMGPVHQPYRHEMPYLSNVLYNFGLGPITLKEAGPTIMPPDPWPRPFWRGVTGWVWGCLILLSIIMMRFFKGPGRHKPPALFSLLLLAALITLEILISPEKDGGLFDRHLLNYLLPAITLLLITQTDTAYQCRRLFTTITASGIALFAAFGIAGTHDYLAWNRARWEGLHYLMKMEQVPPQEIDGGFEFNGWYLSDTFGPQNHHYHYKRKWWVAGDTYRILWQMTPQLSEAGYTVFREIPYKAWLGKADRSIIIAKRTF